MRPNPQASRVHRRTTIVLVAMAVLLTACASDRASLEANIENHPSFPCYSHWLSTSKVAGLAGVVPWVSRFESVGIITYDELFSLADEWVPETEMAEEFRQFASQMPDDSASEDEWDFWKKSVIIAVYQWALFHLDLLTEIVADSTDVQTKDQEPLLVYVTVLTEYVEDQWALAGPVFEANPQVNALDVVAGTRASDKLYQAWRDVTEDNPFDNDVVVKEVSMNVCGEEVLGIGVD